MSVNTHLPGKVRGVQIKQGIYLNVDKLKAMKWVEHEEGTESLLNQAT